MQNNGIEQASALDIFVENDGDDDDDENGKNNNNKMQCKATESIRDSFVSNCMFLTQPIALEEKKRPRGQN